MKRSILLGGALAALLAAGCSPVGTVGVTGDWHETRALVEPYEVVKKNAEGSSSQHQISLIIVPIATWGDSVEDARNELLASAPGSEDVINVRSSTTGFNLGLYQVTRVYLRGTAIKYVGAPAAKK